jgi:hypothetical protein
MSASVALAGLRMVTILTCTAEQARHFVPDQTVRIEIAPGLTVSASCLSLRSRDNGEVDVFLATTEAAPEPPQLVQ